LAAGLAGVEDSVFGVLDVFDDAVELLDEVSELEDLSVLPDDDSEVDVEALLSEADPLAEPDFDAPRESVL
jgi:hypothetical protein